MSMALYLQGIEGRPLAQQPEVRQLSPLMSSTVVPDGHLLVRTTCFRGEGFQAKHYLMMQHTLARTNGNKTKRSCRVQCPCLPRLPCGDPPLPGILMKRRCHSRHGTSMSVNATNRKWKGETDAFGGHAQEHQEVQGILAQFRHGNAEVSKTIRSFRQFRYNMVFSAV